MPEADAVRRVNSGLEAEESAKGSNLAVATIVAQRQEEYTPCEHAENAFAAVRISDIFRWASYSTGRCWPRAVAANDWDDRVHDGRQLAGRSLILYNTCTVLYGNSMLDG